MHGARSHMHGLLLGMQARGHIYYIIAHVSNALSSGAGIAPALLESSSTGVGRWACVKAATSRHPHAAAHLYVFGPPSEPRQSAAELGLGGQRPIAQCSTRTQQSNAVMCSSLLCICIACMLRGHDSNVLPMPRLTSATCLTVFGRHQSSSAGRPPARMICKDDHQKRRSDYECREHNTVTQILP